MRWPAPDADEAQRLYELFKTQFDAARTRSEVQGAIRHAEAAHAVVPTAFKYPYAAARAYHYLDDYLSCVRWFDRAIALGPHAELPSAQTARLDCEAQLAVARVRGRDSSTLTMTFATKMGGVNREIDKTKLASLPRLFDDIPNTEAALAQALEERFPDFSVAPGTDYVVVSRHSAAEHVSRIEPFFKAIRRAHFSDAPIEPVIMVLGPDGRSMSHILDDIYPGQAFPDLPFFGLYNHRDRLIMAAVGAGYGSLLHEIVHALVAAQFPTAPLWYEESLATLYERTEWRGNTLVPLPNWRMDFISEETDPNRVFDDLGTGTRIAPQELAWLRMLLLFAGESRQLDSVDARIRETPDTYLPVDVLGSNGEWPEFVARTFLDYRAETASSASNGLSGPAEIRFVQHALNRVITAGLVEDGLTGTATDDAIREFQRRFGLDVDGVVGTETMSTLRRELAKLLN